MNGTLTILMYHYVRPLAGSSWPRIRGLDLELFRGQLDYLERHYSIIDAAKLGAALKQQEALPARACLLTFDDGYSDHYRFVFPELRRRGLSGVFFAPSSAILDRSILDVNKIHFVMAASPDTAGLAANVEEMIEGARHELDLPTIAEYRTQYLKAGGFDSADERYVKRLLQHALPKSLRSQIVGELFRRRVQEDEAAFAEELYVTPENLREMAAAGMTIGCHGHAHSWLDKLTAERQADDLDHSLRLLDVVGVPRADFAFCYPYGAYDGHTLELLRRRGCAWAVTTVQDLAHLERDEPLRLPRLDTNELPKHDAQPAADWTLRAAAQGPRQGGTHA